MVEKKDNSAFFNPGKYKAKSENLARIEAEVTVDQNSILDVKLRSLKGERGISPDIEKVFRGQIVDAQSVNIDGISGATLLTKAVKSVVGEALADARNF